MFDRISLPLFINVIGKSILEIQDFHQTELEKMFERISLPHF
jgi:hypothetical protein